MRISIVIPAFNEERLIGETLRKIREASNSFGRRGWEVELIVCDNNSNDRTAEIARATGARVVFEPMNQIARARNTGAKAATGDWLVFVDADSHPSAELFGEVAEQIQSGQCLAGGCTVRLDHASLAGRLGTWLWNGLSRCRRLLAGSFIFVEAAAFRKVGGFSQELFVGEELDLSRRLHALAREQRRELVILHRHPLLTSARKLRLYTTGEYVHFLVRAALNREATVRSREACVPWYDGRR